jgi:hypothetical protein
MTKTLRLLALLPVWLAIVSQVNAETSPLAADAAIEPLQMIVDYGQSQLNPRETHHGVMEPVGLPANQQVAITLRFLKKRAGSAVTIGRLDGGEIDLQGPVTISFDGSVLFHFYAAGCRASIGSWSMGLNDTRSRFTRSTPTASRILSIPAAVESSNSDEIFSSILQLRVTALASSPSLLLG